MQALGDRSAGGNGALRAASADDGWAFDLVRRCAHVSLSLDDADALSARVAASAPDDWARAATFAASHAVASLLLLSLRAHARDAVPPAVLARLGVACRTGAARSIKLASQLAELSIALQRAGVRAIALKGPALALSAYGSLALRTSADLDVLVAPQDVAAAARVLADRGYPVMNVPPEQMADHLRSECEHAFLSGGGRITVDLHWQLFRRYLGRSPSFDALWTRATRVRVLDVDVPALGGEDMLVMLCQHGSSHAWERLGWVCDVNELLRSRAREGVGHDWARAFELAREAGAVRALRLGLTLAHDVLDAPVAPAILVRCRRDGAAARLARRVMDRFANGAGSQTSGAAKVAMFQLASRDGLAARVRYCLLAAAPNTRDHNAAARLPGPARTLGVLVRPVRLLRRHVLNRA